MHASLNARFGGPTWRRVIGALDSYASLLALLLLNFFMLELIDDPRWGAVISTLLGAAALVIAISDPEAGETVTRTQGILIVACVLLAPIVLVTNSTQVLALAYLLPVALLVCATLPITIVRGARAEAQARDLGDGARRALQLRAARTDVRVRLPGSE